jgi:glucan phosphoethanolaminetransferase (alkaline phosphatase superfamily)
MSDLVGGLSDHRLGPYPIAEAALRWRAAATSALGRARAYAPLVPINLFLLSPVLLHDVAPRGALESVGVWNLLTSILWLTFFQVLAGRPAWFFALATPLAVVVLADLFLLWEFGARLTTSYLTMIVENLSETRNFVRSYWPFVLVAAGLFLPLYGALAWRARALRLPLSRRWALAPLALVLGLYGVVMLRQARDMPLSRALLDVATHDTNSPFGIVPQAIVTWRLDQEAAEEFARSASFRFGATRDVPRPDGPEVYVLVVGESSRPDHWALNGYARETSPRLSALGGVLSFTDVVTQSSSTHRAVPLIITRVRADEYARASSERSIITAFKEAGFKTWWLSTQEISHWAGFIFRYAAESDVQRYFERKNDDALLPVFEQAVEEAARTNGRALIVLHTTGSHFEYSARFPSSFAAFSRAPSGTRRERLVDAYDDSIRFTDHILAELIARLQRHPDLTGGLLYVSDHGENLLDDERQLFGHAFGTEQDLRVATLFWPTPALAAARPELLAAAARNRAAPLSTANVFHSLAHLGGLTAPGFERERSLFSPTLARRPRVYMTTAGEVRDFDEMAREAKVASAR